MPWYALHDCEVKFQRVLKFRLLSDVSERGVDVLSFNKRDVRGCTQILIFMPNINFFTHSQDWQKATNGLERLSRVTDYHALWGILRGISAMIKTPRKCTRQGYR